MLGILKKSLHFLLAILLMLLSLSEPLHAEKQLLLDRIDGEDRFHLAVRLADQYFSDTDTVILVNYLAFPDAVSAGNLSQGKHPILYSYPDRLPAASRRFLQKTRPQRIYLLGGEKSLSKKVEQQVKEFSPMVIRLSGADRYEVSAKTLAFVPNPKQLVITSGQVFSDALIAAPYAKARDGALLLVGPRLSTVSKRAISQATSQSIASIQLIGGKKYLPDAVEADIRSASSLTPSRISAPDRYDLSAKLAKKAFFQDDRILCASGEVFADALVAGPLAQAWGVPILLCQKDAVAPSVLDYLQSSTLLSKIYLLGGEHTVSLLTAARLSGKALPPATGSGSSHSGTSVTPSGGSTSQMDIGSGQTINDPKLPESVRRKLPYLKENMSTEGAENFVSRLNAMRKAKGFQPLTYDSNLSLEAAYRILLLLETRDSSSYAGQFVAGDSYDRLSTLFGDKRYLNDHLEQVFSSAGSDPLMTHIGLAKYEDAYAFILGGKAGSEDHLHLQSILSGAYHPWEAQELLRMVNTYRADRGLAKLEEDPVLMDLAAFRAREITGLLSHTRPDGTNFKEEFAGQGMYRWMSENLGTADSAKAVFHGFLDHKPHRESLESKEATHIGVACFRADDNKLYWAISMGKHSKGYHADYQLKDLSSYY